ncbi:flagellar motor switch protein FliG [Bradyrhizobium sp. U87765 SZCCT0131]|uniref:flagellar motor switch protein FliG n=1 Tax=unclassified Bradyrhizobium TaxID=2631580 RepID=UPI001BAABE1A|nr:MULTISPECIES: flagellar motor switch protein FliG [unclassified Bradyrhizobium]MBR1216398.1 flagellar motor switch protein FliG [Bradyrhizobium sp. U87765 SZCCT0131]MBR1259854.1 flagellar motor switch protein FliG [Bradyrhizobium sp. U87765 SZCCT0134]MBR1305987.1 flagellar motor switch protein FliG [Bradyrhizobium sp. U87765 SZCCT0110]MBR1322354.1 flagellar motor switch protein FliG [Bradyrhizobium sp. U87765 SZCCT0109]MBR1352355.1 flagellar motor switch protein FliG [Bradyrhizobium sp. U87
MAFNAPAKRGVEVRPLRGTEKVAALLLAMGRELSGGVLKEFDPEEIRLVTRAAAELKPVSGPELEEIIEEFARHFGSGPNIFGTVGELEKLLNGVLPPEQVTDIISEVLGNKTKSVWERISAVSESLLANYLLKEHPQTAALILSRVKPACAARVMSLMPPDHRHNLMRRMLSLKPVVEDAMGIIEKTMHEDFMINFARNLASDTYPRMADIINKMERAQMEETLKNLSESRPKSAEILKGMLFTFDDIVNLTAKARMSIFDQVPTDRVVIALKGTDSTFRELILSSLASRTRRLVEHELANGVPSNQREIMDARRTITDMALEMAGRGEIELNPDQEDQQVFT